MVSEDAAKLNARVLCPPRIARQHRRWENPSNMIVSHKHKFVFIKTNKTAGTSTEIALSKFCGPQDIIAPISAQDEATRHSLGYPGAQNYLAPSTDYGIADHLRRWISGKQKRRYYNHMSAREVKGFLGEKTWNEYYKFCFERHPYDRVISLYYWRHKKEPRPSISQFLDSGVPNLLRKRGYDLYTIDGTMAVDRVCLYENMSDELRRLEQQFGFASPLDLPRAKGSHRTDRRNPRDILDEVDKQRIRQLFRIEFELFGYDA